MPLFNPPAVPGSLCVWITLLGYWTVQDVHCCSNDTSLYFLDEHNIRCIDLKTSNHAYVNVHTVKTGLVEAGAIDIDHRNRMVYWSDNSLWTINRMNLDTSETEVIIRDDLGQVDGIAVEWESGLIYWTDYILERIEVAKLNGSSRKTLVFNNLNNPRGIAVDPRRGFMFWTDWGILRPKIERADLTGEYRQTLVNFRSQRFPISLVIEFEPARIYWMDTSYLNSADFKGHYRRSLRYIRENINPIDLALYGDNLYWVDRNGRSIHWFNKTRPVDMLSFGHLTDGVLVGAVVSDESRQPIASAVNKSSCRLNNGGCSHLCLLAPGGRSKCACPNGVALQADNKTCSNVTQPGKPPPPVPDVKVRLRGSNSSHEGRVEVYHEGEWGTICDDHWGLKEAAVVCRMLNYSTAGKAVRVAYKYYGRVNSSFRIWMDNVKCRGDEQTIAACRHNGWNVHDCNHIEDAGIVCKNDSIPPTEGPNLSPGPHPELKVRLQSGKTINQGRVELFLNNTWGTICDDHWGIEEANVICRMLNYSEGAWSAPCCGWFAGYHLPRKIWLDDVHCVGDERSIAECRHGGWAKHNCKHGDNAGVVCKYTPIPTPGQTLRLADGYRDGEGRVEIFHDGYWGTVCDDIWDIKDAQVVCRQLGYSKAIRAPKHALFGKGNGHIWLDNVNCLGNESSIENCQHRGWNNYNYAGCYHFEDASVICSNVTESSGNSNIRVLADSENFLLSCEGGRKLCYFIPIQPDGGSPHELIPLNFHTSSTCSKWQTALSYDPVENTVYWTDGCRNIYRGFLNSRGGQVVIKSTRRPMDIEIDLVGRNIYFADQNENTIRIATLDGSYQAVLVEVPSPQGIALDSVNGFVYFSSVGNNPQILRADMDGKNKVVLANLSYIGSTTVDVLLDKPMNRLFFCDKSNNVIRYVNLSNMEIHTMLSGNLHHPTSLTMLNNTLYWTAEGDGTFSGAIFKAEAVVGSTVQMVADGFGYPKGIYARNSRAPQTPSNVKSPCENNGGCSQLCVVRPKGRSCVCHGGMKIADDGRTCVLSDAVFVADKGKQAIFVSSQSTSDRTFVSLPFQNITSPRGVAFNPLDGRIYWTDSTRGVVARSSIDGQDQEDIHWNVVNPSGIALDLVGGNVYWISNGGKSIEVSKLNGDYRKELYSNLYPTAREIALDTKRGFIYWSSYSSHSIHGAELDGANRQIIASLRRYKLYGVRGIALDVDMNRVYFTARRYGGSRSVSYIDLNNSKPSVETLAFWFPHYADLYGIAVGDQFVYFTLQRFYQNEGMVYRTSKTKRGGHLALSVMGLGYPRGVAVQRGNTTRKIDHPCAKNNGGCTHLCLIKPNGYHCACPTVVEDGRPCSAYVVSQPSVNCTAEPCENEATCQMIGKYYKCHCAGYYGGKNCSVDFSDEVVLVYITGVTINKFNKKVFIQAIVDTFNAFCSEFPSKCSLLLKSKKRFTKRAIKGDQLKPEDVYIPSDPEKVDGNIVVEFAVVATSAADWTSVVVPSEDLVDFIKKNAAEIGQRLGGTIVETKTKSAPIKKKKKPTSETPTKRQNAGLIAGVTVAVGLLVIITAIAIWYFRIKRKRATDVPYENATNDNKPDTTNRVTAFENPGFDNVGTFDGGAEQNLDPVVFSSFEEVTESVESNPVRAEVRMTRISPTQTSNTDDANGVYEAKDATPHVDAFQNEIARDELPKKDNMAEKSDNLSVTIQEEAAPQEETRYITLDSENTSEQNA